MSFKEDINDQSSQSDSDNGNGNSDGSDTSNNNLEIDIVVEIDPIIRVNIQTIDVTVAEGDPQNGIANADTVVRVFYTTDFNKGYSYQTTSDYYLYGISSKV